MSELRISDPASAPEEAPDAFKRLPQTFLHLVTPPPNAAPSYEAYIPGKRIFVNETDNPIVHAACLRATEIFAERGIDAQIVLYNYPLERKDDKENHGKPYGNENGLVHQFLRWGGDSIVTGKTCPTGDVFKPVANIIGAEETESDRKGLISSFFAMPAKGEKQGEEEGERQETWYVADAALIPTPDPEQLAMIAEQTANNVARLMEGTGKEPIVAFLQAPREPGEGPGVADKALALFQAANPGVKVVGAVSWKEARKLKANTYIMPGLFAGNGGYKMLHDPHGSGWEDAETGGSTATVLQNNGERLYLSRCGPDKPTAEELATMAIETYELALDQTPSDQDPPTLAMLSFSTYGSSTVAEAEIIEEACKLLRSERPDIPMVERPAQWDAVTEEEEVFLSKSGGKRWPGRVRADGTVDRPRVLICPDRDSSVLYGEMLQDNEEAGRLALGPVFQGVAKVPSKKDGELKPVMICDMSRGATEDDVVAYLLLAAGVAP
jgi:phosphotransacetylase